MKKLINKIKINLYREIAFKYLHIERGNYLAQTKSRTITRDELYHAIKAMHIFESVILEIELLQLKQKQS